MNQRSYTIKCLNCGKERHYEQFTCYMQKINAFRCNCGGKLVVIEHAAEENMPTEAVPAGTESAVPEPVK